MNNKNIKKTNNEYTKENRELGELFLEVFDFKKRREMRVAPKKENIEEKHYLEQLTKEQGVTHKEYAKLKKKIKNHPLVENKISDDLIRYILRDFLFSKQLHKKNLRPEEMGFILIDEISKERSSYLVIFPLNGFIPDNRFFKLGNVVFGTSKEILEHFNFRSNKGENLDIKTFEDNFLRTVSVGTSVTTFDRSSALTLAENKINLSLNFMRIFIPMEYNLYRQPKIRISYEIKERFVFPLPIRESNRIYSEHDLNHTAIISNNLLGKFKTERILEEGKRILKNESYELSELEKIVLDSLEWIGEAIDSDEFHIKVVKCVVGLETLFKLRRSQQQKEFIECVVNIFQKSSINIKKLRKASEEIYDLRSRIVHQGKRNIKEEDAEIAERLASGCLLTVFDNLNRFSGEEGEKDFYTWLKKKTDN